MTFIRVGYLWKTTFDVQRPVYYNKNLDLLYYTKENNREPIIYNYYPSLLPISVQRGQHVVAEKKVFNFTIEPLLWKLKRSN